MVAKDHQPIYTTGDAKPTYLDIQAAVGVTKHMGGFAATDTLHRLCHLEHAETVLEVGCGIGVGPVYITKRFDCEVVAVDISEKMLSWAQQRARREGVVERITFRKAEVCVLPFEDDSFDAAIVESVLAFVEDKETAIRELIRVIKPGGYIGLNESYWTHAPPPELLSYSITIGPEIITEVEWRAIWEATPLEERTIQAHSLEAQQEIQDRLKWVGWRSILSAWGRVIKLLLTNPRARSAIKEQFGSPTEMINHMGYALFVGRKPQKSAER